MEIYGSFYTQQGEKVTVSIITQGSTAAAVEIGSAGSGIWFADDPVETESQVNDTFDHLLLTQARVRLLCRSYQPQLFASSPMDVQVTIAREGECVFSGFVEPMSLSQGYNADVDEVELTCIDRLCALRYAKYSVSSSAYAQQRKEARQRSWLSIITEMLQGVATYGGDKPRIWYEGSKSESYRPARRYDIFSRLAISELLFLGEKETDIWTQDKVLEEMLRYLDLHMAQVGSDFYIFSWDTLRNGRTLSWRDLVSGEVKDVQSDTLDISMDIVAADDATITVGEVYNKISLTAKVEDVEDVVESPLDDDQLSSPYSRRQLYLVEYAADKGSGAYWAMRDHVKTGMTDYGGASKTSWHVQVMRNAQWLFPMGGDEEQDIVSYFLAHGEGQHSLPRWLGAHMGAALLSVGSVKERISQTDTSPADRPSMSTWLVVSVCGNEVDTADGASPSASDIKAAAPVAVYEGAKSGGVLSPADDKTTNYIVISGKMVLNPVMRTSAPYASMLRFMGELDSDGNPYFAGKTVPSRTCKDGRYYTRQYMSAATPADDPEWKDDGDDGWYPYTGCDNEYYAYKYSAVGDGADRVKKVGVLACMLIVGDKCAVETGADGTAADITWQAYKERDKCASDDEYYQQCFTIGFDPKIGDCLIGKEYDMQNTVTDAMNVDADGIAIPIKAADKVSGQVRFVILGVCNTLWDDVTRRHPTFFRHTSWKTTSVPLMAHVSSVVVKDFSVKAYTDNGLQDRGGESSDIVYTSDMDGGYCNEKDDIEMCINSALTSEECTALGVRNRINLSTPLSVDTGAGVLTIYDRWKDEQVKPEQDYIDSYYQEYHLPRVTLQQKLRDEGSTVSLFNRYRSPAMGKTFHVQGISRNLMEGWAQMDLKEVGDLSL